MPYSGHFVLRLPRGLHAELSRQAREEGVSLNQYVATLLAGATGWQRDHRRGASERRILEAVELSETLTTIASAG